MLRIAIYLVALSLALADGKVLVETLQCVDDAQPELFHSIYHAPARPVSPPVVNEATRRGFLELFRRSLQPSHSHSFPQDTVTTESCSTAPPIPASIIAQINALCSPRAFFYSLSARHINASTLLVNEFTNTTTLPTPEHVLSVAQRLLHRHDVNPRLWFTALVTAFLSRPDLNGYLLPWQSDASPDLYVTNSIIQLALAQSSRPAPVPVTNQCISSVGVLVNDVRLTRTAQANPIRRKRLAVPPSTPSNPLFLKTECSPIRLAPPGKDNEGGNVGGEDGGGGYGYGPSAPASAPAQIINPATPAPPPAIPIRAPTGAASAPVNLGGGQCILYNGTSGATGPENLLWYFREDMQVNHHHWYWHQYFPPAAMRHMDRRGEMFYFAHHAIIARYNAERLSNGLPIEAPLDLFLGGNIGSGYNGDLIDTSSGRFWTPRLPNMPLSHVAHENDPDFQLGVNVEEIRGIYDRMLGHIRRGFLVANRTTGEVPVNIQNQEGLSHLGNTFEAAEELSLHANLYHNWGVHNLGHVLVGLSTDPDYRCQLPTGVMADLTVTMRDPAFYKIHSLVDYTFDQHKRTLQPYQVTGGEWPLAWDGVKVSGLEILTQNGQGVIKSNYVKTFWSIRRFPLEEGIDGTIHEGDVNADICHQHLNHEQFTFRLTIDVSPCLNTVSSRGTVRIFMAPRYNIDGRRFAMDETRQLMFQLDAFPVELRRGRNTITRNSVDSSSTRPWSRSLQDMLRDPSNGGQAEPCACGWPNHLYIPKGNELGMEFDLFAMVTNFDQDQVVDSLADLRIQEPCRSAYLFCGIPYRRYPDPRPMGYPFDRFAYSVVDGGVLRPVKDLDEYMTPVGNMKSVVVTVQHLNVIIP